MSKSALTRADKKAIREAIARANRTDRREKSAQDSIPFLQMWPDGICQTTDKHYTKTVQFQDINYQLCKPDDKDTIFGGWAGFLNYFDSSIDFSLSFLNRSMSANGLEAGIFIENTGDDFDAVRDEYNGVLEAQLALGNNSIIKTKYLTFGLDAKSHKDAETKLKSIENAVLSNFKKLGVPAAPLSGKARLRLLHSIFHIGTSQPFRFNWKWLVPSGLSVKDFVSPSSFEFKTGNSFRMGDTFGQANFLQIDAAELDDRVLADLLDVESDILVTLHIHAVDRNKAIKTVKRKITDLDRAKIEEQKKAVRSGYDMDIIPSDLATYGEDAKTLLRGLQKNDEHMFLVTPLIVTFAGNRQDLKNQALQLSSIAQRHNCSMVRLDFQQEEGLMSSLPLGNNLVDIQRGLTTSSTAIFVPFTTQELFQPTRRALYYGINALSNNMIMVDRQVLKNPNGLILGVPGSGKSFSAKREILNVFLACPEDDIIICDPEGEYTPLVTHLNGQVVKISPSGIGYDGKPCYVNPLDLNIGYDDGDPLTMKYQFMLSFFELIAGGRNGLQPTERTIIDRCVHLVYQKYLNDLRPENMPTLGDLYQIMLEQEEKEARYLATALEIYVSGSLNVFNHQTTVDLKNRVVCYDIKDLGSHLKKIGMMIIQDQVWNRVSENRKRGKTTRYYVDEFHLLLADPETAAFSTEIWKRFRKWGGVPTGITQNVKDLLSSDQIENIFENSDFIYLLSQAPGDRAILAEKLNISPHQLSYVTQSGEGEGLMIYGGAIIPFVDHFPRNTELYKLLTTRPAEVSV